MITQSFSYDNSFFKIHKVLYCTHEYFMIMKEDDVMGKSIYFLARESDFRILQAWIEKYEIDIIQNLEGDKNNHACLVVLRKEYGNCVLTGQGPDMYRSPAFYLLLPYLKSNRFYTVGEVRVLQTIATMKAQYPLMLKAINELGRLLKSHQLVFDCRINELGVHNFDGQLKLSGYEEKVYALPAAYEYLNEGNYFISGEVNDYVYKKWLEMIALRGQCSHDEIPALMDHSLNHYFKLIDYLPEFNSYFTRVYGAKHYQA